MQGEPLLEEAAFEHVIDDLSSISGSDDDDGAGELSDLNNDDDDDADKESISPDKVNMMRVIVFLNNDN